MPLHIKVLHRFEPARRRRVLGRGRYHAKQIDDEIVITATGDTPTPNYKVWLQRAPERIFPPITELWWMPPTGIQIQLLTAFSVHTSFHVGDRKLETVTVRDAEGSHQVAVEQVEPEPSDEPKDEPGRRVVANAFRLSLGEVPVSYASTSLIGEPIMSIGDRQFTGDEIDIEETTLGQQVSVVTESVPDLETVTFSLILPQVLLDGSKPAEVEVPGVTATHHTTIAGPPLGQGTSYQLATLTGVAEHIVA